MVVFIRVYFKKQCCSDFNQFELLSFLKRNVNNIILTTKKTLGV